MFFCWKYTHLKSFIYRCKNNFHNNKQFVPGLERIKWNNIQQLAWKKEGKAKGKCCLLQLFNEKFSETTKIITKDNNEKIKLAPHYGRWKSPFASLFISTLQYQTTRLGGKLLLKQTVLQTKATRAHQFWPLINEGIWACS